MALPVTLYLGGELSVRAIASQWSAIYNLKVTLTRIEAVGMQQRRLSTGADGRNVAEELESPAWVSTLLDSGPDGCGPSGRHARWWHLVDSTYCSLLELGLGRDSYWQQHPARRPPLLF